MYLHLKHIKLNFSIQSHITSQLVNIKKKNSESPQKSFQQLFIKFLQKYQRQATAGSSGIPTHIISIFNYNRGQVDADVTKTN